MKEIITKIEAINPKSSDVIVMYFNTEILGLEEVRQIFEHIQESFPNNQVIALPNEIDLEVFDKRVLSEQLNDIIKDLGVIEEGDIV